MTNTTDVGSEISCTPATSNRTDMIKNTGTESCCTLSTPPQSTHSTLVSRDIALSTVYASLPSRVYINLADVSDYINVADVKITATPKF